MKLELLPACLQSVTAFWLFIAGSSCLQTNISCQIEMNIQFESECSLAVVGEGEVRGGNFQKRKKKKKRKSTFTLISPQRIFLEPIVENSMISWLFSCCTMHNVILWISKTHCNFSPFVPQIWWSKLFNNGWVLLLKAHGSAVSIVKCPGWAVRSGRKDCVKNNWHWWTGTLRRPLREPLRH